MSAGDPGKLDRIVAEARRAAEKRERGYREPALKIYPWKRPPPPEAAPRPTLPSQVSKRY